MVCRKNLSVKNCISALLDQLIAIYMAKSFILSDSMMLQYQLVKMWL